MKRSRNLKLTLMAALPAALVTGCGSEPETGVVLQSASDCYQIKQEQGDIQQCLKAYDEAVAKHQQAAPRFLRAMSATRSLAAAPKCLARPRGSRAGSRRWAASCSATRWAT